MKMFLSKLITDNMKIGLLSLKRFENIQTGQGIPRYIQELYTNLKVIKNSNDVKKIILPNFKWDALSFYFGTFNKDFTNVDVIHNPIGFLPLATNKKKKYVVTIHDALPVNQHNFKWSLWHKLFFTRGIQNAITTADKIITDSLQTSQELITLGCDKDKLQIVSLGIDKRFSFNKTDIKKSNNFLIGYIGSFASYKNIESLFDVVNYLNKTEFKIELWGHKTYIYNYLKLKSQFSNMITFPGFAPEPELIKIYDTFDVFVFPSLYEGFGLPILEAQARELPVIIYKKSKISKEVRKYCFEAEDPVHMAQIIQELKENGYNEKTKKKATEYARSFTWEKTAIETLSVYTSMREL